MEVSLAAVCCEQFRQIEKQLNALDPMLCSVREDNMTSGKQLCPFENTYCGLGDVEAMSLISTDSFLKWGKRQLRVTYYVRIARRNIHATLLFFLSFLSFQTHPSPKNNGSINNIRWGITRFSAYSLLKLYIQLHKWKEVEMVSYQK